MGIYEEPGLAEVESFVASIPEPGKQDAAREFLTVAQERLEAYRDAALAAKTAEAQAGLARKASERYVEVGQVRALLDNFDGDALGMWRTAGRMRSA